MNLDDIVPRFLTAVGDGTLDLPFPGEGATAERFDRLTELGRTDLSLARLAEAHTDAVAILHEAGRTPPPGSSLGVWAAEGPGSRLAATRCGDRLHLRGAKRWCSGAGIVTHALVTAHEGDRAILVLLPVGRERDGVTIHDDGWVSPAFTVTRTERIEVDTTLPADAVVGPDGFYLDRPGFWYGAIGVAACWAGGIAGLADLLDPTSPTPSKPSRDDSPMRLARARTRGEIWNLRAILHTAAERIDSGELADRPDERAALALTVRHLVDRSADAVIHDVTRTLGPGPMAHDADLARRLVELQLYVRQSHADRDLDTLATLPPPP